MSVPVHIHDGRLIWSGEHWINAIRPADATGRPSAWISLFSTRYSAHGGGHAAQVIIPDAGIDVICTDNRDLCAMIDRTFFAKGTYYRPDAPVIDARFECAGPMHRRPAWTITWAEHRVTASWVIDQPPIIASGSFREGTEHFTILFFTDQSSMELDGQPITGQPYPRDIWKKSLGGGDRSSSVIALAETLIEVAEEG